MADDPGVRAYGENVGVSSLRMCCGADGGGCGRPGGGLDVVLMTPLATSSTLFGAAGGGAESSLSNENTFEVLRGSGGFEGGAAAGEGDGRDGDAMYALSK